MTIQIGQRDPAAAGSFGVATESDEIAALRAEFDRNNCARLPQLLSPDLLERVRREVDDAEFVARDAELKREHLMQLGRAHALLSFLANDPALFEVMRAVTGCPPIGYFDGRVYRMVPELDHESAWHSDLSGGRVLAMSINLSEAAFEGGALEIRDTRTGETLARLANTGPAETVLIRLAPGLEHRVTRLEGDVMKTAFVGFFVEAPAEEEEARAGRGMRMALRRGAG